MTGAAMVLRRRDQIKRKHYFSAQDRAEGGAQVEQGAARDHQRAGRRPALPGAQAAPAN